MGEKMHPLYTGRGDSGYMYDLLGIRIKKESTLAILTGKIDSLQGSIDSAILEAFGREKSILERVQKNLWQSYPMIQDPKNSMGYITNPVTSKDLQRLEAYIWEAQKDVRGNEFIRFETRELQTLNQCRVLSREVEPYLHRYIRESEKEVDSIIPAYFNRLSSLFFAMAVKRKSSGITKKISRKIRVFLRH